MTDILLGAILLLLVIELILTLRSAASGSGKVIEKLASDVNGMESRLKDEFSRSREELGRSLRDTREELNTAFNNFSDAILKRMADNVNLQDSRLDGFEKGLRELTESIAGKLEGFREQIKNDGRINREDQSKSLKEFSETFSTNVKEFNELQKQKFDDLAARQTEMMRSNEEKMDKMRDTVEKKLGSIQEDNTKQLERMRETVDEKLHKTLEERLGDSFKIVSERLEKVREGLGEMKELASGVGDLKKVLTNVKTKGILGEYQLENILEQLLTPAQYEKNAKTKANSSAFVEFAIKLPGRNDGDKPLWLPIDSKFPSEDFSNLMDAYDAGDAAAIDTHRKLLFNKVSSFAKDISEKYIDPPNTTDFGVMFLPFEGLYAEVLRDPALFEELQRKYKVIVTGPTTLSAFLNSLQVGFRTLAIQKRSGEVWSLLGAVKTEFEKFGGVLDKTKKKLQEASNVIEQAGVRTRAIERKLRDVQELPEEETIKLLEISDNGDGEE